MYNIPQITHVHKCGLSVEIYKNEIIIIATERRRKQNLRHNTNSTLSIDRSKTMENFIHIARNEMNRELHVL